MMAFTWYVYEKNGTVCVLCSFMLLILFVVAAVFINHVQYLKFKKTKTFNYVV